MNQGLQTLQSRFVIVNLDKQLQERLELAEQDKLKEVELAKSQIQNDMQGKAAAKDSEIQDLKAKLDTNEVSEKLALAQAPLHSEWHSQYDDKRVNIALKLCG